MWTLGLRWTSFGHCFLRCFTFPCFIGKRPESIWAATNSISQDRRWPFHRFSIRVTKVSTWFFFSLVAGSLDLYSSILPPFPCSSLTCPLLNNSKDIERIVGSIQLDVYTAVEMKQPFFETIFATWNHSLHEDFLILPFPTSFADIAVHSSAFSTCPVRCSC